MKIKKADEMEMAINYKAVRLAYAFGAISLVIWMIIDFIINKKFPFPQFIIISIQNIIFFGSKAFITHRMTSNKHE